MSKSEMTSPAKKTENLPAIAPPRLPYHPGIKERFGVDQTEWRALVESTFPSAKTVGAVILALSYCKARNLDPFKKMVHIVPIWDKERGCYVETVWPGIAEYRVTAMRTALYAGHDPVEHGPVVEKTWDKTDKSGKKYGDVVVTFPEWSQMTVYRMCAGQRVAFPGPQVYWLETYAAKKDGCPNEMWSDRPIGMLDKCAEAAALRSAFPEELGDEPTSDEWAGFRWHGRDAIASTPSNAQLVAAQLEATIPVQSTPIAESELGEQQEPAPQPEPEPGAESDALDEYCDLLGQTATADAVRDLQAKYAASFVNSAVQQKAQEKAEMRLAEVQPRGQRSNKQRSMLPQGTPATEAGV